MDEHSGDQAVALAGRTFEVDTIIVRANNRSDCAHGCRYCPIRRKQSAIDRERYANFVERVQGWMHEQRVGATLYHSLGYHDNYDHADLDILRRLNGKAALPGITLGGLPQRSDEELRDWLGLLKEYGLRTVHATFGGSGSVHDGWNNKAGNFDLLMRTLRCAGELDLALGQRLLVGKSTLASLEPLLDQLQALPPQQRDWRYAMPFFYQTTAQKAQAHVEADRIDESVRDRLPGRIRNLFSDPAEPSNLSEREWIALTRDQAATPDRVQLVIRLTAHTIDWLEAQSIERIVGDLTDQTRHAYQSMPTFHELLERYGDSSNTQIYAIRRCVEMKWLDLYRRDHPDVQFDQSLTHLWFGA